MRVGAENRSKLIAAIALMVVAAGLLAHWLFSSEGSSTEATSTPAPTSIAAEPRRATPARKTRAAAKPGAERSLDPSLRYDLLKASEDTQYKGSGRNIFQAQVDIPKPIRTVRTDKPAPPRPVQPQGPPPPPPIDLKFFGFASRPGEPKRVFLSQGEDVFIGGEGDIVDRRYKILRISAASVEVEDVLNNNRQEIFLTPG